MDHISVSYQYTISLLSEWMNDWMVITMININNDDINKIWNKKLSYRRENSMLATHFIVAWLLSIAIITET